MSGLLTFVISVTTTLERHGKRVAATVYTRHLGKVIQG